jgi:hypothetical protein
MTTRDEYVSKLKSQLDRWNAEAAKWEAEAKVAQAKQLEAFRTRRDEALYNLKLVESASASAWQDLAKGADAAWDKMQNAFASARSHFEKSKPPKTRA